MRLSLILLAVSLLAQDPDGELHRRNVWLFPPRDGTLSVDRIVATRSGVPIVNTPRGVYALILGEYVPVPGLPTQSASELRILDSGEVGIQFSNAFYATDGRTSRAITALPAGPPASGSFRWGGFDIRAFPGRELKVHRERDGELLLHVDGFHNVGTRQYFPGPNGKAFFQVGDRWILLESETGIARELLFPLPNKIFDIYLDNVSSRLYLALQGRGLAIADLMDDSGSWLIRREPAALQLLNGKPAVAHVEGFSSQRPASYEWLIPFHKLPPLADQPTIFGDNPALAIEEAQQALSTTAGTQYLLPRDKLPVFRKGNKPWRSLHYDLQDAKPLPVRWLHQTSDQRLWAAAKHGLIEILNPDSDSPTLRRAEGEFAWSYISEFARAADGSTWLAGEGFIASYQSGKWIRQNLPSCVVSGKIRSIAIRNASEYWIAYRNGAPVTHVTGNGAAARCTNYGAAEGNPNVETNQVSFDQRGWLWMFGPVATLVFVDPARQDRAVVLPHYVYLPSGSAHWHGFIEPAPAQLMILVGKFLAHLGRDVVLRLANAPIQPILVKSNSDLIHLSTTSPVLPELSYSVRWRWKASDGRALSEFAPPQPIRIDARPDRALAIEVLTHAGSHILPFPTQSVLSPLTPRLGLMLSLLLGLPLLLYRYRWRILLQINHPATRRRLERSLFLKLRAAGPVQRQAMFKTIPSSLHSNLRIMLEQFERMSESEDDRTRSGLVLDKKYLLEHVIAKGGFATVYLAQDLVHPRPVAVKLFLQPAREESWLAKRLTLEIEALRRIQHPGVVQLLGQGQTPDGRPYLVMDYIQGITLRQALRSGPLNPTRARRIIDQLSSALIAVHAQGILHRDLKPENIILRQANTPEESAMLIDFGVATVYDQILDGSQSTFFAGSLDYSAPEQVAGLKLEAADVYSLGVVAFEVFTGQRFKHAITPGAGEVAIRTALEMAGWPTPAATATALSQATTVEHSRRTATISRFRSDLATAPAHSPTHPSPS